MHCYREKNEKEQKPFFLDYLLLFLCLFMASKMTKNTFCFYRVRIGRYVPVNFVLVTDHQTTNELTT